MEYLIHSSTGELYHHGIKGQKWGVRRFQNADGSLTSAGRSRYGVKERVSDYYKKVESTKVEQYKSRGFNDEAAAKKAAKDTKTLKTLAVIGGVSVAALAGYGIYKYGKNHTDTIIKSGTEISRVTSGSTTLHDKFYAATNEHDAKRYEGLYGATMDSVNMGKATVNKIVAQNDVKVASYANAKKTYMDLMKNDPQFRLAFKNVKNYDQFNQMLVYHNNPNTSMYSSKNDKIQAEKFYQKLKEKGYGALRDENDYKYSGFKAKNPTIFFDQSANFKVTKSDKIADLDKKLAKERKKAAMEAAAEGLVVYGPMSVAYLYSRTNAKSSTSKPKKSEMASANSSEKKEKEGQK